METMIIVFVTGIVVFLVFLYMRGSSGSNKNIAPANLVETFDDVEATTAYDPVYARENWTVAAPPPTKVNFNTQKEYSEKIHLDSRRESTSTLKAALNHIVLKDFSTTNLMLYKRAHVTVELKFGDNEMVLRWEDDNTLYVNNVRFDSVAQEYKNRAVLRLYATNGRVYAQVYPENTKPEKDDANINSIPLFLDRFENQMELKLSGNLAYNSQKSIKCELRVVPVPL